MLVKYFIELRCLKMPTVSAGSATLWARAPRVRERRLLIVIVYGCLVCRSISMYLFVRFHIIIFLIQYFDVNRLGLRLGSSVAREGKRTNPGIVSQVSSTKFELCGTCFVLNGVGKKFFPSPLLPPSGVLNETSTVVLRRSHLTRKHQRENAVSFYQEFFYNFCFCFRFTPIRLFYIHIQPLQSLMTFKNVTGIGRAAFETLCCT